jgi:hypothetical protein
VRACVCVCVCVRGCACAPITGLGDAHQHAPLPTSHQPPSAVTAASPEQFDAHAHPSASATAASGCGGRPPPLLTAGRKRSVAADAASAIADGGGRQTPWAEHVVAGAHAPPVGVGVADEGAGVDAGTSVVGASVGRDAGAQSLRQPHGSAANFGLLQQHYEYSRGGSWNPTRRLTGYSECSHTPARGCRKLRLAATDDVVQPTPIDRIRPNADGRLNRPCGSG